MSEFNLMLESSNANSLKNAFKNLSEEDFSDVESNERLTRLVQIKIIKILSTHGLTTDFITGSIKNPITKEVVKGKEIGYVRNGQITPLKNAVIKAKQVKDNGVHIFVELVWFPQRKPKNKLQEVYSITDKPGFTKEPLDD
jgi:hypothetical protein